MFFAVSLNLSRFVIPNVRTKYMSDERSRDIGQEISSNTVREISRSCGVVRDIGQETSSNTVHILLGLDLAIHLEHFVIYGYSL